MKLSTKLMLALTLALAQPAYAAEGPSAEVAAIGKTLDFVADVSKYQGMFDSVVAFCRPHAPARILERARQTWLSKNQRYLDLRDQELAKVIENARANGTAPDRIAFIESWAREQYQGTLGSNRMHKDLLTLNDLPIACSRRLGEMNYPGMDLRIISPRAVEYAENVGEP